MEFPISKDTEELSSGSETHRGPPAASPAVLLREKEKEKAGPPFMGNDHRREGGSELTSCAPVLEIAGDIADVIIDGSMFPKSLHTGVRHGSEDQKGRSRTPGRGMNRLLG